MELKEINVLVSGASIAGLSTAYWLTKYGFRVTVVERASHIRSGGQALDVRGPALEVAERMGILAALHDNSTKLMPNIFNLDHWEMFFQHDGVPIAACIVKEKDNKARTYLGFSSDELLTYDYRDVTEQKQLLAERVTNVGTEMPKIVEHMQQSENFYFDSMNQIIMDHWCNGRAVLVGDAAYSVSPATGQGTTIAMVGAYVLAGELAAHKHDLQMGLIYN